MTVAVATSKVAFDQPFDPISSSGMLHFAQAVETLFNDILNGAEAFERQLFTTATAKTIASGAITAPTLALHTVAAESGSSDNLETIGASNNFFVVLKAAAGHTITIIPEAGNISSATGGGVILSGNRLALLWCQGSEWALVGAKRLSNNISATTDPGSGDDIANGYGVGSYWVNTTLDRAWLCLDATAGAAIWKSIHDWKNYFEYRFNGTSTSPVGVGCAAATFGTGTGFTMGNDNDNLWGGYRTNTGATDIFGPYAASAAVRPAHSPYIEIYVKTDSTIADRRFWIGLSSAIPNDADALTAGTNFIGFRWSAGIDIGWQPVLNDGVTQNAAAAEIGTVAINSIYKLKIRMNAALTTAYFSVNDSAEVAVSTNFPAIATDMAVYVAVGNQTGAQHGIGFSRTVVYW